jgi:hypothetical protein
MRNKFLDRKVSILSLAGILKTPPKLLKEIEDWAASVYCQKAYKVLHSAQMRYRSRNELQKTLINKIESKDFINLRETIENLSDNIDSINSLIPNNSGTSFEFQISYFSETDIDEYTGFEGVYGWVKHPESFRIFIYKLKSGLFNFYLNVKGTDTGLMQNIDQQQIHKILLQYSDSIAETLKDFARFVDRFEAATDNYLKQIKSSMAECSRHIKQEYKNPHLFYIDKKELLDIKYLEDVGVMPTDTIRAEFIFDKEAASKVYKNEEWSGLWKNQKIYIYHPIFEAISTPGPQTIKEDIERIKITARHELQHAVQWRVEEYKMLKEKAGLPSKKIREKEFDIHGIPAQNQGKEEERLTHGLRDVEFYTRLKDSVEKFKQTITKFPKFAHKLVFETWIGRVGFDYGNQNNLSFHARLEHLGYKKDESGEQKMHTDLGFSMREGRLRSAIQDVKYGSQWFNLLKENNPGKYRKAIIEFYKEVSHLL